MVASTSQNKILCNVAVALRAVKVTKNGTASGMSQRMILINSWVCAFGHSIYAMSAINNDMNNGAAVDEVRHVSSALRHTITQNSCMKAIKNYCPE